VSQRAQAGATCRVSSLKRLQLKFRGSQANEDVKDLSGAKDAAQRVYCSDTWARACTAWTCDPVVCSPYGGKLR
jgi:hypothetical protein